MTGEGVQVSFQFSSSANPTKQVSDTSSQSGDCWDTGQTETLTSSKGLLPLPGGCRINTTEQRGTNVFATWMTGVAWVRVVARTHSTRKLNWPQPEAWYKCWVHWQFGAWWATLNQPAEQPKPRDTDDKSGQTGSLRHSIAGCRTLSVWLSGIFAEIQTPPSLIQLININTKWSYWS